ncbi:MAG TPA: transketolase C-terminal domain-containing protein, partial [Vicinamibacteria bacterium]
IAGVGGGFDYGSAGPTHHGIEDVGVLRLQTGLTILAPADPAQARTILLDTWDRPGPIYYRLGKDDRTFVSGLDGRFQMGRSEVLRRGEDLLLLVSGSLTLEALAACDELRAAGIHATLALVSTLSPVPAADLRERLEGFAKVVTIEAHHAAGGLGTIVAEVIAENGLACRLIRLGVREGADGRSGSLRYLLDRHGLSKEAIVAAARNAVG